jgi:hypothetical protein
VKTGNHRLFWNSGGRLCDLREMWNAGIIQMDEGRIIHLREKEKHKTSHFVDDLMLKNCHNRRIKRHFTPL